MNCAKPSFATTKPTPPDADVTTPFKQAIAICGLSQQEAAEFLNVSKASVDSWCNGRREPQAGVWKELAVLYDRMDEVAEACLEIIGDQKSDEIEFTYSGAHGHFPSDRCAETVEAMVRLRLAVEID